MLFIRLRLLWLQLIQNWDYDPTWFGQLVMRELEQPVELP